MKKILIAGAILVVTVSFVFYRMNNDTSSIKIGAALALTGFCSTWGEDELRSIKLAIDEVNDKGGIDERKIELIVEDTGCEPRGTVSAVNKLINADKVEILIGPTWADSFQGGNSIINKSEVVAVTPSAAMEALMHGKADISNIFSAWFPQRDGVRAVQAYMESQNKRNIVIMHDEDPFGLMLVDLFQQEAASHNIKIVKEYNLPLGYSDFRTEITELKKLNPDGIYASFLDPKSKAKFLKQAHDLGLKVQLFSSSDIQDADILREFGPVLDGVIYSYPKETPAYEEFRKKFVESYNAEPLGPSVTSAYDATNIVMNALQEHHKKEISLKEAVEKTDLPGVTVERLKFNQIHGLENSEFQIKTIQDGKFVEVK